MSPVDKLIKEFKLRQKDLYEMNMVAIQHLWTVLEEAPESLRGATEAMVNEAVEHRLQAGVPPEFELMIESLSALSGMLGNIEFKGNPFPPEQNESGTIQTDDFVNEIVDDFETPEIGDEEE